MSNSSVAPSPGLAESRKIIAFFEQSSAITEVELRKLLRDPTELLARAVQPVLWLVIFGQVFGQIRGIPTGEANYLAFMTPGILAQSVLFSAIFYGIGVIWERDFGIIHKLLVSPASRTALVFGKAVSAGVRGLVQTLIIYLLALGMRIDIAMNPASIFGVMAAVMLGSATFATFSLVIACLVKTRERFMGIGQLLTMPLFFASNAIYPLELMPGWLKTIAHVNPLTYLVDALRVMMLASSHSNLGLGLDFTVLVATFVVLHVLAVRLYPTLVH